MPSSQTIHDRNLLFGILAVQMDFISREALIAAMNAWVLAKQKSIGQILVEQKALPQTRHDLLETLVGEHLKQHGNDAEKSLAAVAATCSVDPELRRINDAQVQASLLHVAPRKREHDPYATMAQSVGASTSTGTRFRILRPHAEGGLGKVSVARDEELGREVALKEIKERHADNTESRSRFLLEAEVTGGLEHPGIVPVYGLGQYADGRPYYAMRFIRGESLKEAADRFHKVSGTLRVPPENAPAAGRAAKSSGTRSVPDTFELHKLLRRFVDVCNAIAYAHSRGVLHRDLKPGNIMLGQYGETLVVDWGLAKTVDSPVHSAPTGEPRLEATHATLTAETQMGQAIGTPQFMSPEQAAGRLDVIGPASDIYSLGATLYYVLVGRAPFEGTELYAILNQVQRGDFPPPRALNPAVPRPLDAICLKAMALNPQDRYATLAVLADDVEHWLADEPVSAYPEPWTARLARTVRRHKSVFAGSLVVLLTAIAALSVSTFFINRARRAAEASEQKAVANFKLAQDAVDNYLTKIGRDQRLKAHGLEPLRRDLLATARDFYDNFAKEKQNDPELERARGMAYTHLAYITAQTGSKPEALALYTKALEIFNALVAADPKSGDIAGDAGEVQYTRAELQREVGKLPEAEKECNAAIKTLTDVAAKKPSEARYQRGLAAAWDTLGQIDKDMGRAKEAEDALVNAMKVRSKLAAENAGDDDLQAELAKSFNNLGAFDQSQGRFKEAEAEFQQAIEICRHLADKHPDIPARQYELAQLQYNSGVVLRASGQTKAAEDAFKAAAATDRRLADEHPEVQTYQLALANVDHTLGNLYRKAGRDKEAESAHLAALDRLEKLAAANPQVADYRAQLAAVQSDLSLFYTGSGNFPAAEKALLAALKLRQNLVAAEPQSVANQKELGLVEHILGNFYKAIGRNEDARAAYLKAVDIRGKASQQAAARGDDAMAAEVALAESTNELGVVQGALGQKREAGVSFHAALEIDRRLATVHPDDVPSEERLADVLNSVGVFDDANGKKQDAEGEMKAAVDIWERLAVQHPNVPQHDRELARVRQNLGDLYRDSRQFDKAEAAYRGALEIGQRLLKTEPTRVEYREEMAWLYRSVGFLYVAMKRPDSAARDFQRAAEMYAELAKEHPDAPLYKKRAAEAERLMVMEMATKP